MAEKSVIGNAVKKLEEEITCPLCLGPLDNPKRLPCDHIYCKSPCLEGLLNYARNSTITCPECRTIAQVQNNDLDNLPNAFQIERLKDLHSEMAAQAFVAASKPAQAACQPCPAHPTQLQELYCDTCHKIVCRDCILLDSQHKDHKYCLISEVAAKQRKQISNDLQAVEKLEVQNAKVLAEVEQAEADMERERLEVTEQITTSFDALFQVLEKEKQALLDSAHEQADQMIANITAHKLDLRAASSQLQGVIGSVTDAVTKDGDTDFVSKMDELRARIVKAIEKTSHSPTIQPHLEVTFLQATELRLACSSACSICKVYLEPEPSNCIVDREGFKGMVGKTSTVVVKLADKHNRPCGGCVTAKLKTLRDGYIIQPEVIALSHSSKIVYTPTTRGRHELTVKVNGEHVAGSPFRVFIRIPYSQLKEPVARTTADLVQPAGLHYASKRLFISDYDGDKVVMYNHELKRVAQIGGKKPFLGKKLPKLQGCNELTTDRESNVFITTVKDNCLHKFSKDGTHIKTVSGTGEPGGQFDFPNAMCVFNNCLFVCDTRHDRVVVFDTELNYLSTLTTIPHPSSIDIDAAGRMYISTDIDHGYIRVLDAGRKLLYDISHCALNHPVTAKTFNDLLYVTDLYNNCVVIFTLLGEYVGSFGHGHLVRPEGIAIDDDGYFYVTNNRKDVLVF